MSEQDIKKIVIIGAGPAGYTAAIYAARAGNEPTLIEGLSPGGQLMITTDIENFPGFAEPIPGPELMMAMRTQAERVGAEIISDVVESVDLSKRPFTVRTQRGEILARTLIVATGAEAKWLGLDTEEKFKGRGVSACATCDGFFFKNRKVAVIGGGDTACEEANYLTNHASEVFLVHRREEFRASQIMVDRALNHPKITAKLNKVLVEVLGDDMGVTGIKLKDTQTGEIEQIDLDGVFIAIGHQPSADFLGDLIKKDTVGYLITEPGSTKTSVKGVFAAGDVQDSKFRQAVTAAGTGCMAAIEAGHLLDEER